jgi:hypothetical protein
MRKIYFALASIAIMALTIATSYGQEPDKKSEKAGENLKEAKSDIVNAKLDLKEAQKDSVSDYQSFKKESELRIKDNEKSIADLKLKSSKIDAKNKATYQKKVGELEIKNAKLKSNLDEYKDDGHEKWTAFKTEFNHEMNELGQSIKDFTVNNKL